MKEQTYIRIEGPESVSWFKQGEDGAGPGSGHGTLTDAATALAGSRPVVFVPGESVLLTRAHMPGGRQRHMLQAVPYLLEDHLVADVDTLHFALGAAGENENAVAVIDRHVLEDWLARLAEAGIQASVLTPDVLGLPLHDRAWTLMRMGERVLLRQGGQRGMAMDLENVAEMLTLLLDEAGDAAPDRVVLYDFGPEPWQTPVLQVPVEREPFSAPPLACMVQGSGAAPLLNLLQGGYSQRERLSRYWRPWRPALGMIAALLVIQVGAMVVDYVRLSSDQDALKQQIMTLYRQTFPEDRNVPNPQVQMERHLAALRGGGDSAGGGSGFTQLLEKVGQHFKETPKLELQRMGYKAGGLDVALTIGDLQQLDQLKQRLVEKAGVQVDIQSATSRGDKVEARMKISGGAV